MPALEGYPPRCSWAVPPAKLYSGQQTIHQRTPSQALIDRWHHRHHIFVSMQKTLSGPIPSLFWALPSLDRTLS